MENEQTIALLTEIRDLQKLHVENYLDALRNQRESITLQSGAVRLYKRALLSVAVVVIVAVLVLIAAVYLHR